MKTYIVKANEKEGRSFSDEVSSFIGAKELYTSYIKRLLDSSKPYYIELMDKETRMVIAHTFTTGGVYENI